MNEELKTISELAIEYNVSVQSVYNRIRKLSEGFEGLKPGLKRGLKPLDSCIHEIKKDGKTVRALDLEGQSILRDFFIKSSTEVNNGEVLNQNREVLNLNQKVLNLESDGSEVSLDKIRQILHSEFSSEFKELNESKDNQIKELKQTINILSERLYKMDEQLDVKDRQIESLNQLVSQAQTIAQTVQVRELMPPTKKRQSFFDRFRKEK